MGRDRDASAAGAGQPRHAYHRCILTATMRLPLPRLLASAAIACAALAGFGAGLAHAQDAPAITGVTPDSGSAAGGSTVDVSGSGFTPGATVTFGGIPAIAVQVSSAGSLTAVSPPGSGTIDVEVADSRGASPPAAHDWFAYEPAPGSPWLGLDGNSTSNAYDKEWLGPADLFSRSGIVYDRSFDFTAGMLPGETEGDGAGGTLFEDRLRVDHELGMIPVSVIEYRGYGDGLIPDPAFPSEARTGAETAAGRSTIDQYVEGFIRSASALISIASRRYPGMPVLVEPMNEPWMYTTPMDNGAQYAHVIARLLPAARAAGIPLSDIYVSAYGADERLAANGVPEEFAPGWVPAMYGAEPSLRSEIAGWYFHPYGPPSGSEFHSSLGIQSLPAVRAQMTSGADNVIVSEIGFCARRQGGDCHNSGEAETRTHQQAASRLTAMLENARPYHEAGWLKALIVYGRGDGGWAMVDEASRRPNAQGDALLAFAAADGAPIQQVESCLGPEPLGRRISPYLAGGSEAPCL